MRRGRIMLLTGALLASLATAALAQDAPPEPAVPGAAAAAPGPLAPLRRPRPRIVAVKPPPLVIAKHPAQPPPPRLPSIQAGVLAPMPNRNLEAPIVVPSDRASLGPSVINRSMPGRGLAAEGAPSLLEDKLFRPAPGARLNVPFSY